MANYMIDGLGDAFLVRGDGSGMGWSLIHADFGHLELADEQIARWQAFRARYAPKDDPKSGCLHQSGWIGPSDGIGEVINWRCMTCGKPRNEIEAASLQSQIDRLSGADEAHAEAIQRLHVRIDALQDQAEGANRLNGEDWLTVKYAMEVLTLSGHHYAAARLSGVLSKGDK